MRTYDLSFMDRYTPCVWVGRSKLIWVVNLRIIYGYVMSKWKNFYWGGNGTHFPGFLGFGAVASSDLKIFSWDLGYPSVYLLQTYFSQYQLDLDGAHGYIVRPCTIVCIWANIAWGFLVPSQTKSKWLLWVFYVN